MSNRSSLPASKDDIMCEICDRTLATKREYITHLHGEHNLLRGRLDPDAGPPLACSRCRERFWSYEGLERHLVMNHNLVTSDLLHKAQNKVDGGRCKHCKKVTLNQHFCKRIFYRFSRLLSTSSSTWPPITKQNFARLKLCSRVTFALSNAARMPNWRYI